MNWKVWVVSAWLGLAGLYFGYSYLAVAITNPSPVVLEFAEYQRVRPADKWLELKNAWADYRMSVCIETSKRGVVTRRDYFVPLFSLQSSETSVVAFLHCQEQDSVLLAKEGVDASQMDEASWTNWAKQNQGRLLVKRTIRGLLLEGVYSLPRHRELIAKGNGSTLALNYAIIDENQSPELFRGLCFLLGGLAILLSPFGLLYMKRRRERAPMSGGVSIRSTEFGAASYDSLPPSEKRRTKSTSDDRPPWEGGE